MNPAPHTPSEALADATARGLNRVDAFALLGHVVQQSRAWLIAHDDVALSPAQQAHWAELCQRRQQGEPVAYLVGEREFHGLRLAVTPAVLIPRPDTEVLVDWALECLAAVGPDPRVLDLGTGSGAIALAIKQARPDARVTAVDASATALQQALLNSHALGLPIAGRLGSWWAPVAGQRFDLVVSNPPYIAEQDAHLRDLRFEPQSALTSGADGLNDLRHIIGHAPAHLMPGAWLLLEHGWDQVDAVNPLLQQAGLTQVCSRRDWGGQWRCSGGQQTA